MTMNNFLVTVPFDQSETQDQVIRDNWIGQFEGCK